MVADVPLGAFLSGGIDSTIIVGLMQQASSRPVKTFSIGFDDPAFDETPLRRAGRAGTSGPSTTRSSSSPKAWETLPALAWQFDEPFADSSALPTWHVARETRRAVTVALTGDAGDELFGGYDRYRAVALAELLDRLPGRPAAVAGRADGPRPARPRSRAKTRLREVRRLLEADRRAARGALPRLDDDVRRGRPAVALLRRLSSTAWPGRRPRRPDRGRPRLGPRPRPSPPPPRRDPVTRAMVADLLTYLPGDLLVKVDMASMAHSLECRGPFLDHRVVELAAGDAARPQAPAPRRAGRRSCSSRRSPTCSPRDPDRAARWASASRSTAGSGAS